MIKKVLLSVALIAILVSAVFADAPKYLTDGDKTVAVSYETDVLVLGSSVEAVAAAEAVAKTGAKTMLITDNNYLGEDLTATLRLWKPQQKPADKFAASIYDDDKAIPLIPNAENLLQRKDRIPFKYTIAEPFNNNHPDTKEGNRLTDGIIGTIEKDSVQTDGDMTVTLDFGEKKEVGSVIFTGFHLNNVCIIVSMTVEASDDGEHWKKAGFGDRLPGIRPVARKPDIWVVQADKPFTARYLRVQLKHSVYTASIFGAELFVFPTADAVNDLIKKDDSIISPPRPLHVKKLLDETLIKSGVEFLYGAFVTGDLKNQDGEQAGVLISNRAGRQAVAAKRVIDLRTVGLNQTMQKIRESKSKTTTIEFIVVGGEPAEASGDLRFPCVSMKCEVLPQQYLGQKSGSEPQNIVPYKILRYLFEVDSDYALAAFGGDISKYQNILTEIRLATYHPQLQFSADQMSLLAPQEKLYEFKETKLHLARSIVKETANADKALPKLEIRSLRAESGAAYKAADAKFEGGQITELTDGIRPFDEQFGTVQFTGANYEIAGEYDVVVIGGGTTGAPAGIAAARAGAKTLVVELQSELGGVGTLGSITGYYFGNITGFTKEVDEALYPGKNSRGWSAALKSKWWLEEIKKNGGEVWLGVLGAGAVTAPQKQDGRTRVCGVLLATPLGTKVVLAKTVIDTTGAGDIARAAGSEMVSTTENEITVQGAGLSPRGLGSYKMNNDYTFVDDTDPIDVTHLYVYGKEKYPDAFDQGKVIGTRERRQIVGDFTISALDQLLGRTYDDSIARSYSDFDLHGYSTSPFLELYHPVKREAYYTYYPYRASLPKNLDGILVGALATSSNRDAIPMTRMQADLQNQGYALGYIATMAAKQFGDKPIELRKVNIRDMQKHLVEIGILPESALTETDSYESMKAGLPKAIAELPENAKNALLIMKFPQESLPLVKAAYEEAADFDTKILFARVLAQLGDKTGEGTLLETVKSQTEWDKGWNFRGMSNFGSPSSQLDKDIMMLGRLKSKAAVPLIVEKLNMLKAKDEFSHHRACYLALEEIGDKSAAKALAEHLKKPGMQGHATLTIDEAVKADKTDPNVNLAEESRRSALRETGAARALYHLGDYEGLGKKILEQYSKDLRGHFARNAAEILGK